MRQATSSPIRGATLLALLGLALWPAAALADGSGVCYRAKIDYDLVLPDGSSHGPGTLTICSTRSLSPVAWLHEISVEGETVAMFSSKADNRELAGPETTWFVFSRRPGGPLLLEGYEAPHYGELRSYQFDVRGRVRSSWWLADAAAATDDADGRWVFIAAARR